MSTTSQNLHAPIPRRQGKGFITQSADGLRSPSPSSSYVPGQLFERVKQVTEAAKSSGHLFSIESTPQLVPDCGVEFIVRVAKALEKKPAGPARELTLSSQDPFLDPEPEMVVTALSARHRLLLNKYNVVPYHLLIVTTAFESQCDPLNTADFEAALGVMSEIRPALLFYNSGEQSGASQPHKHLQLVPLPLLPDRAELPIEPALMRVQARDGEVFLVPEFDFEHYACKLDEKLFQTDADSLLLNAPSHTAAYLERVYRTLMQCSSLDIANDGLRRSGSLSYNFLLTRRWALLVVRRAERLGNVMVNSLGFSGTMLVKTPQVLAELLQTGPMKVLRAVAAPHRPLPCTPPRITSEHFVLLRRTSSHY